MIKLDKDWISAAKAAMAQYKVPASVTLAQFGLESGWGKHMPLNSNNPFGIKAFHGNGVSASTTEVINGKVVHKDQPFAVFSSLTDAFIAHARLIAGDHRYAAAMQALPNLDEFVVLMAAHYATDPEYAHKIMEIIDGDNLRQYDGI